MKAVAGFVFLAREENVSAFATEVRDVDYCERIGGLDPQFRTAFHDRKPPPCLEYGQRAFQPPEIVDRVRGGHFCQNFQKGFLGSSAAGATAAGASGFACGTGTLAVCATSAVFVEG